LTRGKEKKRRRRSSRAAGGPPQGQSEAHRIRGLTIAAAVVVCMSLVALAVFLGLAVVSGGQSAPRAAIVDQLSLREPNPDFVETVTTTLEGAGYAVDYYPGEEVTVEFYRELPTHGYDLVVLRAHSAIPEKDLALPADVPSDILERIMAEIGDDVLLFTSEPYSDTRYVEEQKDLRLFPVIYAGDLLNESYFAIASDFVESSMRGKFDQTTIILMGCSSLASESTAAALVHRGAEAVVGWTDTVSPSHTDAATERLLEHLVAENLAAAEAVEKTMAEVDPDPWYGAEMLSYPRGG
jgi:hypothetical protein